MANDNENNASLGEKVVGTTGQVAGTAVQAGGTTVQATGTAVEASGRATQAAGATVEVAGKTAEVTGKGMQAAGKGMQAAGKGVDAAGQGLAEGGKALIDAGAGLSSTAVGAIAGVPMIIAGGLGAGLGYGGQAAGKGLNAAGKGTEVAGKGVEKGGQAMNKAGKGIRKTGGKIANTGKDIRKEGKEIKGQGKEMKNTGKKIKSGKITNLPGIKDKKRKLMLYGGIAGAGCAFQGLLLLIIITVVFAAVSSVTEALSPVTDFFASLGHWFAGDGWCPNEVECAKLAESDFYTKVDDLYKEYYVKDGVELDTEVLTAAAIYNRFDNFNGITDITDADEEKDTTAKTDEEKKNAYKDGKDRLEKLAREMAPDGELDYSGFKRYLVNSYLPEYYKDLYDYYPSNEQTYIKNFHANAILSFSKNPKAYDALANSKLGRYCSSVKITDDEGNTLKEYKLEEYVERVVDKHGATLSPETQKSLAITVRTYVIQATDYCEYSLSDKSTALPYSEEAKEDVKKNIEEVKDLVMYYKDSTFLAKFDNFTGSCDSSSNKCKSVTYTKIPSDKTHSFEVDTSKVFIPTARISDAVSSEGLSLYGAENMSKNGKKYEEILKTFFADDIEIKRLLVFESDFLGTEGIYKDLLYPVGWPNTRGACQSAGEYYPGGSYHGSQDLACGTMGLWGKCTEIPIISAHDGVVTWVVKNQQCNKYSEQAARSAGLRYDPNCGGNGIIVRITDQSSEAYGYTERYWHFSAVADDIHVGSEVHTGQFLGYMGSTGNSSGYHLHYNLRDRSGKNVIMDSQFVSYCKTHTKKDK